MNAIHDIFKPQMLGRILLCIGILPILSQPAANVPLDRIVAVVNDDVIMLSELEGRLREVRERLRTQGAALPQSIILERQVLDHIIQTRLQAQLAELNGIVIDDDSLQQTLENIARDNDVSIEEFRDILESDGHDFDSFKSQIRNEMMISQLRMQSLERRILVTDREVDEYLANRELRSTEDADMRLAHILLSADADASADERAEARRRAERVRREIVDGADFAEVARAEGDSRTADSGGDLGWRKFSELPSLFVDYIPDMEQGDVSEVIESPNGFHLIKLVELRVEERVIVEQSHARHILIRTDELLSDEDAQARLEQLRYRLGQGDDFAVLAKAHSQDFMSAIEGGDLGWNEPGYFVPEFEEVLRELEDGEISEPFRTQFGWHIVQLLGWREFDNTESVRRTQARRAIFDRKLEERQRKWLREMRDSAYVEYRLDDE